MSTPDKTLNVGQATQEAELLKSTPDKATLEAIAEYKKETSTRVKGLRKTLSKKLFGVDPRVSLPAQYLRLHQVPTQYLT